jgi:hypothetical protein
MDLEYNDDNPYDDKGDWLWSKSKAVFVQAAVRLPGIAKER